MFDGHIFDYYGVELIFWKEIMGRAKEQQIEQQEKVQHAISLCIDAGAIEECQLHEGEYVDTLSHSDAEELTKEILAEDPSALASFKDHADMVDCVQRALDSAGEECGYCAKNRDS